MNKRGQTLVLFVLLLPIVIILLAVIVDIGVVINKKIELKEVTRTVIKDIYQDDSKKDKAIKIFVKNDVDVDNLEIIEKDNVLEIKNEIEVDSIFGNIIGIDNYKIKVDIKGYLKNGKMIFE